MKTTNKKILTGLHILGELYTKEKKRLNSLVLAKKQISKIIKNYSLNELGSFYYKFPNGGFTGIISLVESHIAIHTWPEFDYLTLDVYLCNYSKNNSKICRKVFYKLSQFFRPYKIIKREIRR